jgi:hypothetical protein
MTNPEFNRLIRSNMTCCRLHPLDFTVWPEHHHTDQQSGNTVKGHGFEKNTFYFCVMRLSNMGQVPHPIPLQFCDSCSRMYLKILTVLPCQQGLELYRMQMRSSGVTACRDCVYRTHAYGRVFLVSGLKGTCFFDNCMHQHCDPGSFRFP